MTVQQQEAGFLVTPGQMYAELRSLNETVVRMDAKLDNLNQHGTDINDHETRLRLVEQAVWRAAGAAAVLGAGGGFILQLLMK